MVERHPYGSWASPISAELVAGKSIRLGAPLVDGEAIYWLEERPAERGRSVIVRWLPHEGARDILPPGYSARSRVHEYGGAPMTVHRGVVYFVNDADQRLYRLEAGRVEPITPEGRPYRYANCIVDERRQRLICVREDHTDPRPEGVVNTLVAVRLPFDPQGGEVLAAGHDFYAEPRLSPDGRRLAWLTWDHPRMPWDGTTLWMAELDGEGRPVAPRAMAGGEEEAVTQPEWDAQGRLYFVSDRSNWWNLYRLEAGQVRPLHPMAAEFSLPHWVFGMRMYALAGDALYAAYLQGGYGFLARLDLRNGDFRPIETPFTYLDSPQVMGDALILRAASPTMAQAIVRLELSSGRWTILRRPEALEIDEMWIARPQALRYASGDGEAYAFFYPPTHPDAQAPAGERPPLIVRGHGGPTSATTPTFKPAIQFWTSRGFAVLDVNYGGSTGYGRAYRNRLRGNWGVVDVADMVNGAQYLVEEGLVDGARLLIRGGSAGGFTVLAALTFHETFAAGASYYGIGDLEALTRETHKFESHYLDSLIGPYPERRDLYLARSPIHHIERLSRPVIFFQGDEDRVVPPNQAERMVEALKRKGVPVEYHLFHGEGHGFRKAENIRRALEAELAFYGRLFGFSVSA